MLAAIVQALRPHQWVKNLLVFAPLVFAHKASSLAALRLESMAFVVFCLVSSTVYLLNDLVDRDADRRHPVKRLRPIASGRLPLAAAVGLLVVLAGGAAWLATGIGRTYSGWPFLSWPLGYLVLNLAYSFALKRLVIVDGICIAIGFQIRVLAGAEAIAEEPSRWILLCTFFFALFLAFCKRREELAKLGDGGTRASLRDYDLHFLDQMISPLAAMSVLAYALYTVDPRTVAEHKTKNLAFTVPFVVFGVFRYLYLVHRRGQGADPARILFTDRQLVASGVLWAAAVVIVLSLGSRHV